MATNQDANTIGLPDVELLRTYIHGCHILHCQGIVDAYGHLSVRLSPSVFMMSRYMAPALVSTANDLVLYDVESGEALQQGAPRADEAGFSERFIHSEVYKAFAGVRAVVHSHSLDVVPFSISSTPLRACFHMAGFLGTAVPVWDAATMYTRDPAASQDMLVRKPEMGASLASVLGPADEGGVPRWPVALMRGHGFIATADGVEMAVCKSVYTAQNARVQRAAAGISGGMDEVLFFSEREAHDAAATTIMGAAKPWPLWVAEVETNPLYRIDV